MYMVACRIFSCWLFFSLFIVSLKYFSCRFSFSVGNMTLVFSFVLYLIAHPHLTDCGCNPKQIVGLYNNSNESMSNDNNKSKSSE